MPLHYICFLEKWMENLNLQLGRSEHLKCTRYACHA